MNLYAFVNNNALINLDEYGLFLISAPSCNFGQTQSLSEQFEKIQPILTHPRMQGGMQAFAGLSEVIAGAGISYGSGLFAAPIGFGVMGHGMDHFVTGLKQVITGSYSETATSQVLQKTGMSGQTANLIDSSFSLAGMAKAAAVMRSSQGAFVPRSLPAKGSGIEAQASVSSQKVPRSRDMTFFNFAKAPEMHMLNSDRRVPIQIFDQVIKHPKAVFPDSRRLSGADMYYSHIWKNGKLFNIEVLYNKQSNTILHFKYTPKSLGPLDKISIVLD